MLEPRYEQARRAPDASAITREQLREEPFLGDELDRPLWYLGDTDKWVGHLS